jgi:putative hemolysin
MKKTTGGGPEKFGQILKAAFIIFAFIFLGLTIFINIRVGKIISLTSKSTDNNIPVVNEQPIISIANPASTNCLAQGGSSKIETKPDGSQYGVCYFTDNRQCEEWALLRDNCPVGGLKVTGYITPAAVFCVISGGTYEIIPTQSTTSKEMEQGTCSFANGQKCDVWKFYDGSCSANKAQ